jgi:hypothetical protein
MSKNIQPILLDILFLLGITFFVLLISTNLGYNFKLLVTDPKIQLLFGWVVSVIAGLVLIFALYAPAVKPTQKRLIVFVSFFLILINSLFYFLFFKSDESGNSIPEQSISLSLKHYVYLIVYLMSLLITAKIYFKTFTTFKKSLGWFLYPKSILIWSKEDWDRGMPHSIRFEVFLLIAIILFWALAFIFRIYFIVLK